MRPILMKLPILLLMTILLTSCATTSLVDSWSNPNLPGHRIHRIVVVGFFKDAGNRRVYEDIIANELRQRGVEAIPGYTVLPERKRISRKELAQGVKGARADSVLTLQTIRVEQQTVVQPGYATAYPDYWYPPAFSSWDLYGYYGANAYYEPPYATTYEVANIQVNLFDAESGKLLWAGTVQTSEPGNVVAVSKQLSRIIYYSLADQGLI